MVAPRVEFEGDALDAELVAAPHHVRHVAFELFKNAFRASMDSAPQVVPARRAALSAVSASLAPQPDTVPIDSPVAGFSTVIESNPSVPVQALSMNAP